VAAVAGVLGRLGWVLAVVNGWARACLAVSGCPVRVEGLDRVDRGRRYVVMANHGSALDPEVLLAALPASLRSTLWAKRSLFRLPFLGHAMRAAGFIPVDRVDRSGAPRLLAETGRQLRQGRSVVLFPEETYGPGDTLLPFQRGGFLLALKERLPILPVGIEGARAALPPRTRVVRPTPLVVRFGAPVETEGRGVSERERLVAEVRDAIAGLCGVPAGNSGVEGTVEEER
jgi:1-acyl-sn-glycerol-3-phosphate acyltransferase